MFSRAKLCLSGLMLTLTVVGITSGQPRREGIPAPAIEVADCRVKLIDSVTLASARAGIVDFVEPKEGDEVTAKQRVAGLMDGVASSLLAAADREAENDVEVRYARKVAEVAEAEYEKARQTNQQVRGAIPDIEVQRLKLAFERGLLQIESATHQQAINGLRRDEAAEQLKTYHIHAPFSGFVTRIYKSVGEAVSEGEPVLEIVNTERVRVEGYVSISDVHRVKPRDYVKVQLDIPDVDLEIESQQFEGRVVFVDVKVDPVTGEVRVWAEVQNHENLMRDGLTAKMTIVPGRLGPDLSVPASSTRKNPRR